MPPLTWTKDKEGRIIWSAFSGNIQIGIVLTRHDGSIIWKIDAVHMKWIAKGYGDCVSMESGRRALNRSWKIWLAEASLKSVKS